MRRWSSVLGVTPRAEPLEGAGQTVEHAHLVNQRYAGDVPDPQGGIRGIMPERARDRESA